MLSRIELLEKARQRAYEMVDESSCLGDAEYEKLVASGLPEETVVNRLAVGFLDEAFSDNEIEDDEPVEVDDEDEEDEDTSDLDTGDVEDGYRREDEDSDLEL